MAARLGLRIIVTGVLFVGSGTAVAKVWRFEPGKAPTEARGRVGDRRHRAPRSAGTTTTVAAAATTTTAARATTTAAALPTTTTVRPTTTLAATTTTVRPTTTLAATTTVRPTTVAPTVAPTTTAPAGGTRTLYVHAACATGGNGSTDTCGASGAFRTLGAAYAVSQPGDVIRVRAGTYDERIVYTRSGAPGRPVVWETAGDGPVVWVNTNRSPSQPFVNDWSGAMLWAPEQTGASHVTFRGRAGSEWVFRNANELWYGGAVVLYGNATGTTTTDWTFQHVKILDGATRAGTITAWRVTFEDLTVQGNGTGLVYLASGANATNPARPWSGHVVRRCNLIDNASGGNDDGLIVQDIDGFLIEDCDIRGQYDGFDSGSQLAGGGSAVGPRWVIARRNRATGSNGVMPASTVQRGPVSFLYNVLTGNDNWGVIPVYEYSGNVHVWHTTFVNNERAVNFQSPTTGSLHFVNNLCVAGAFGRTCMDDNGNPVERRTNHLAGTTHANPATLGTGDTSGPVDSVTFAAAGGDYPIIAANPSLIDRGTTFLRTAAASTGTVLTTAASYPGGAVDPRTFFWVGDRIQIAGVGTRTVTALTATTITLDAPATVAAGAGLHYPFRGSAPDIGRSEAPA